MGLVSGIRDRGDAGILDGTLVGFIYDSRTGTFTDIDNGAATTIVHGINSKGEVVGNSFFFKEDDPCESGIDFLGYGWWRSMDGTITYFQVNGQSTRARGINDAGSIVGFFTDLNDGKLKGFNVKLDGSPCQSITVADSDLLAIPGFDDILPEGITNTGVIVGAVQDVANTHGFIATPQ